jgi:hypothetical protein
MRCQSAAERRAFGGAGGVHQDRGLRQGRECFGGQVAGDPGGGGAGRDRFPQRSLATAKHSHRRAGFGQRAGAGQADTCPAAGDQRLSR